MKGPAFFVDGHMEKRITQRICPGAPVRVLNINGRDVNLSAIAKQIATQFRLLGNRYYPVVALIDRETRAQSVSEIKLDLLSAVEVLGVPRDQLIVGVADRMIENWILADPSKICGLPEDLECDGCDGKSVLKHYLAKAEISYHETTVGVDLFCDADPFTVAKNSISFREFASVLRPYCSWLSAMQDSMKFE